MADETELDKSLADESGKPATFVDKQWLYVNDSNNGSYTGQIVLDSTTLSNSGSYIGWSESFLQIPLVLQAESTPINAVGSKFDFGMALKSGYWQLIHSMSVEFNNGSVVQQTPFLNVFSSFKNLTSWSDNDLRCWGKVTGFYPDTADSWVFNSAVSAVTSTANGLQGSGTGFCNNRLATTFSSNGLLSDVAYPGAISMGATYVEATVNAAVLNTQIVLATEASGFSDNVCGCANTGLLQRMKWLNFDMIVPYTTTISGSAVGTAVTTTAGSANVLANKVLLLARDDNGLKTIFKNYIQTTATSRAIVFNAVIRLKDICDFFDKMPLMKGATMRLYINTNQCFLNLSVVPGEVETTGAITSFPSLQLTSTPTILGGGQTVPVMVSSADFGQGMNVIAPVAAGTPAAAVALRVALSIVRCQFASSFSNAASQNAACPMNSVRLYAPAYTMSPQAEASYLAMSPTKKIVYEDLFQYSFPNQGAGDTFNILVSNGLPNLKSIVVMSFLPAASNGVASSGIYVSTPVSSLYSPFASSGGTPDPIALTNFNVQLSGKNLFNDQNQYDFQEFYEQFVSSNQLNGSLTTGLASGLIGEHEWSDLYRYYYCDCSRGLPQEAGVSRSIQITGINKSAYAVNLMVFASFTRSLTVDVRSGVRIE
jgi:hypothetical protein